MPYAFLPSGSFRVSAVPEFTFVVTILAAAQRSAKALTRKSVKKSALEGAVPKRGAEKGAPQNVLLIPSPTHRAMRDILMSRGKH